MFDLLTLRHALLVYRHSANILVRDIQIWRKMDGPVLMQIIHINVFRIANAAANHVCKLIVKQHGLLVDRAGDKTHRCFHIMEFGTVVPIWSRHRLCIHSYQFDLMGEKVRSAG